MSLKSFADKYANVIVGVVMSHCSYQRPVHMEIYHNFTHCVSVVVSKKAYCCILHTTGAGKDHLLSRVCARLTNVWLIKQVVFSLNKLSAKTFSQYTTTKKDCAMVHPRPDAGCRTAVWHFHKQLCGVPIFPCSVQHTKLTHAPLQYVLIFYLIGTYRPF